MAAELDDPRGLALDTDGSLYVSNAESVPLPSVRRIDPTGIITTIAGGLPAGFSGDGGPATAAALNSPRSIALWGRDLYMADSDNSRIRRVDLTTGIIDTVVGTGAFGFGGDGGDALGAKIDQPRGVAATPTGDLVIGDTGNARLRLVRISRPITVPLVTVPPVPVPALTVPPVEILPREAPAPPPTENSPLDRAPASLPARPSGHGYWLVASDGGIVAFGDAPYAGEVAGKPALPVVGIGG